VKYRFPFLSSVLVSLFVGLSWAQAPKDTGTDAGPNTDAGDLPDAAIADDAGPVVDAAGPPVVLEPVDAGQTIWTSCVERLPDGATRPKMTEVLNGRGLSGHAATLEITIVHGKGEVVMPGGFQVERGSDAYKALEKLGLFFQTPPEEPGRPSPPTNPKDPRRQRRKSPWLSCPCRKKAVGTTWCFRPCQSRSPEPAAKR